MIHIRQLRQRPPAWRAFPARDGRAILLQLGDGEPPCCPWCRHVLEARPETRLASALVLDARGYDLDCRGCRRFLTVVRHTPRSLRLVRMRRLAAAVRAMGGAGPARPDVLADPPMA